MDVVSKVELDIRKQLVASPVTHTAEVAMNRASMKCSPLVEDDGKYKRMLPTRIRARKLKIKIRAGDRNLGV